MKIIKSLILVSSMAVLLAGCATETYPAYSTPAPSVYTTGYNSAYTVPAASRFYPIEATGMIPS